MHKPGMFCFRHAVPICETVQALVDNSQLVTLSSTLLAARPRCHFDTCDNNMLLTWTLAPIWFKSCLVNSTDQCVTQAFAIFLIGSDGMVVPVAFESRFCLGCLQSPGQLPKLVCLKMQALLERLAVQNRWDCSGCGLVSHEGLATCGDGGPQHVTLDSCTLLTSPCSAYAALSI